MQKKLETNSQNKILINLPEAQKGKIRKKILHRLLNILKFQHFYLIKPRHNLRTDIVFKKFNQKNGEYNLQQEQLVTDISRKTAFPK